ncbi:zinc-binding dehydrogenase [Roseburia sp.]
MQYAKELAESGKITPVIDKEFSIYDVKDAINYLLKNHAQGKVVVKMDF